MTPETLAQLHAAAFVTERAWSATEFATLLDNKFTQLIHAPHGFALTRTLAQESELLTLAVDPHYHRKGIASDLMRRWLRTSQRDAERAFLEVAADNSGAVALYQAHGFTQISMRPAYYTRKNGTSADALILQHDLTLGQITDSLLKAPEIG